MSAGPNQQQPSPSGGTTPPVKDRKAYLETVYCDQPLSPETLVGSWFHKLENDEMVWQGQVVAEPQAGTYLLDVTSATNLPDDVQVVVALADMLYSDEGYEWRFYDSEGKAQSAYASWLVEAETSRERA